MRALFFYFVDSKTFTIFVGNKHETINNQSVIMIDLLRDLLSSTTGSFAFVFALICIICWLIYFVTKHVTRIGVSHSYIKEENKKTSDKVESFCEKSDRHMDEIRKDISYLKGMIDVFKNPIKAVTESHSPVSLTEIGTTISTELNAEGMIAKNWEVIYKNLEENICEKNAYDIQQYCIETAIVELDKFLTKEDVDTVKMRAFKDGHPLAYYAPIFGILIRNKYLKLKNIDVDEIDKHDPKKIINKN